MTKKQKRFVEEYLIDLNATRAYLTAYPAVKKEQTAAASAARMLRNVKVAEYIQERMNERSKRTEITQDWVLEELRKIASANGTDFSKIVMKNGYPEVEFIETDKLSEDKKAAISAIKETKFGISVETYDKVKALELLGRHLGMWNDKISIKTADLDESIKELEMYFEQRKKGGAEPPVE